MAFLHLRTPHAFPHPMRFDPQLGKASIHACMHADRKPYMHAVLGVHTMEMYGFPMGSAASYLYHASVVPHVNELETAHVTVAVHPSAQYDAPADAALTQLATSLAS